MVNLVDAAQAAITTWTSILRLLAVPGSNLIAIAENLAPVYLPTYTAFDFGTATHLNQSAVREGAAYIFQHSRDVGAGTDVRLLYSRIEPVSNERALVWLTLYRCPPKESNVSCWAYTGPFGFRTMVLVGAGSLGLGIMSMGVLGRGFRTIENDLAVYGKAKVMELP